MVVSAQILVIDWRAAFVSGVKNASPFTRITFLAWRKWPLCDVYVREWSSCAVISAPAAMVALNR